MSAKSMYDLKEMLCKELDSLTNKGTVTRSDLEPIEHLTTSIKNLMKINEMEEEGYSYGEGNWNANGSYSRMPYDGRYSGRRGGNYSRENYSNDAYDMENRMRREMNY